MRSTCASLGTRNEIVAHVENGYFVTAVYGERTVFVDPGDASDDDGSRRARVRGAVWCKDDGNTLACRVYSPSMKPPLGSKVQPLRDARKQRPWSELPWTDMVPFAIDAAGALRVLGKGIPASP